MILVNAPDLPPDGHAPRVFLAGSIEQDRADRWQEQVYLGTRRAPGILLNPRRAQWDSSWGADHPEMIKQITWEMDHLHRADFIAMYFDPSTKSPITLLELGLFAKEKKPLVVCCPEGFWRRANVQFVCHRYGVPMVDTLADLIFQVQEFTHYIMRGIQV